MRGLREIPVTIGPDGLYHAKVTVGTKPNGTPDRRHRSGKTADAVRAKLRELLREVDAGRTPKPGKAPTVEQWFTTWLTDIAPTGAKALAPRTLDDYWSCCKTWVFPHLGARRLDALEPEHVQAMYAAMYRAETSPGRVQKVHAVVRRGLTVAQRWGKVPRNVAKEMDPPGYSEPKRESLTAEEVPAILEVARLRPGAWARWLIALAIGPRQGEVLGLRWSDFDFDRAVVSIQWQIQRRTWRHGCSPACGGKRGADCPSRSIEVRRDETRLAGGLVLCRPKGWRRRPRPRVVALPPGVVAALRTHRLAQVEQRLHAANWWTELDLVFTQPNGLPLDPRQDYAEWQAVLADAGLPPARVHVLRHSTATLLLEAGEDLAIVQEVLGHADPRTTRGYQDVRPELTRRAASKMEALLGGTVTDLVTVRQRRQA